MKQSLLRIAFPLLLGMVFLFPTKIMAEEVPSVVVVNKDGSTTVIPVADFSKILFSERSFTVSETSGKGETYDYSAVSKVQLGVNAESGIKALLKEDAKLAVWPIPAETTLFVAEANAYGTVFIYSLGGAKVMQADITDEVTGIDVSSFAPGVYILTDGESSVRFIKK